MFLSTERGEGRVSSGRRGAGSAGPLAAPPLREERRQALRGVGQDWQSLGSRRVIFFSAA